LPGRGERICPPISAPLCPVGHRPRGPGEGHRRRPGGPALRRPHRAASPPGRLRDQLHRPLRREGLAPLSGTARHRWRHGVRVHRRRRAGTPTGSTRRRAMGVTAEQPAPNGWEIAVAMNAAIKGVLGAMGQSGHVCRTAIPVETTLDTDQGYEALIGQATAAVRDLVLPGDTVIIADKVLGLAQNRIAPAELLTTPDPKTVDEPTRQVMATEWTERLGFPVTSLHLLIADAYDSPE